LSVHTPNALRRALVDDDLGALTLVPGVGKRTAQRLLVELKSRLDVPDIDLTVPSSNGSARSEVRDALTGLGYSGEEVREVLGQLPDDGSVEDLLRDALRLLAGTR
jgi:Holliday junction DNA helicase RuvA